MPLIADIICEFTPSIDFVITVVSAHELDDTDTCVGI